MQKGFGNFFVPQLTFSYTNSFY